MPKRKTMTVAITPTQNQNAKKENPVVDNICPKIKKEIKNVNKDITFISSKNLQSILCQNKQKLHLIVILESTSLIVHAMENILVNQRKVLVRCIEHQKDNIKGNWESSGATEHTKNFHGQFNWINSRTICALMLFFFEKYVDIYIYIYNIYIYI